MPKALPSWNLDNPAHLLAIDLFHFENYIRLCQQLVGPIFRRSSLVFLATEVGRTFLAIGIGILLDEWILAGDGLLQKVE